jgi:hypothetical protein
MDDPYKCLYCLRQRIYGWFLALAERQKPTAKELHCWCAFPELPATTTSKGGFSEDL